MKSIELIKHINFLTENDIDVNMIKDLHSTTFMKQDSNEIKCEHLEYFNCNICIFRKHTRDIDYCIMENIRYESERDTWIENYRITRNRLIESINFIFNNL